MTQIIEENTNISQQIIERIQDMIITGKLSKGDKLPPERQLTEMLGVSRSALREALKALEILGLIERKQGYGNFITGDLEKNFFKPLSLSFILDKGSADDILDLRCILEEFCAKEACTHATAHDIKNLRLILDEFKETGDLSEKAQLDKKFHYEIARMSDNRLIINIMESIRYLMDLVFETSLHTSQYEGVDLEKIYLEHDELIEKIRLGDQDGVVDVIRRHLSPIDRQVLRHTTYRETK